MLDKLEEEERKSQSTYYSKDDIVIFTTKHVQTKIIKAQDKDNKKT